MSHLLTDEQRTAIVRDAFVRGQQAVVRRVNDLTSVAATVDATALGAALRQPWPGHGRSYRLQADRSIPCLWDVPFDDEEDLGPVFETVADGLRGWEQ